MRIPDLFGILLGIALAPILLLAPGYFWSRLLKLESCGQPERAAWSLLLSIATIPALSYNFFLLAPYNAATVWTAALLQIAVPAAFGRFAPKPEGLPRAAARWGRLWIFPVLLALLAVSCVVDVERGVLLYRGYPSADYAKHVAVTDAVDRTGVHPVNPAFYPGRPLPLFFYFFWFLLCSMLATTLGGRGSGSELQSRDQRRSARLSPPAPTRAGTAPGALPRSPGFEK